LKQSAAAQRDEIARLKGPNGRPSIEPGGMEKGTEAKTGAKDGSKSGKRRRRGQVAPHAAPESEVLGCGAGGFAVHAGESLEGRQAVRRRIASR